MRVKHNVYNVVRKSIDVKSNNRKSGGVPVTGRILIGSEMLY